MSAKIVASSLISLLLISGAVYYLHSQMSDLQDFHGNLTPTEHMLCRAQQFQANDYNNCIMNYRDYACQSNYYNFLFTYRQNETKFYQYYELAEEDVQYVVQGWNRSCNTFEHYRRCGAAEKVFTHCVFNNDMPSCSAENYEYIRAANRCQETGDVPQWTANILAAQCMSGIVGLAKGELAEALACS